MIQHTTDLKSENYRGIGGYTRVQSCIQPTEMHINGLSISNLRIIHMGFTSDNLPPLGQIAERFFKIYFPVKPPFYSLSHQHSLIELITV